MSYYGKDSEAQYAVPLVRPDERPTTTSYVTVEYVQKRKKSCGGCCCCFLLTTFLLLFFLIPRSPVIFYKSSSLSVSGETAVTFTQTFQFKNENYYQMDWDDLHVSVYYCTATGSFPLTSEFTCDAAAIGTATYNDGGKFHTGSRGSVDLELLYDFTGSPAQVLQISSLCYVSPGYVFFLTTGTVHAKLASGKDFGDEVIRQYTKVTCLPPT